MNTEAQWSCSSELCWEKDKQPDYKQFYFTNKLIIFKQSETLLHQCIQVTPSSSPSLLWVCGSHLSLPARQVWYAGAWEPELHPVVNKWQVKANLFRTFANTKVQLVWLTSVNHVTKCIPLTSTEMPYLSFILYFINANVYLKKKCCFFFVKSYLLN